MPDTIRRLSNSQPPDYPRVVASTRRTAGRPKSGGPDRRQAILDAARQEFRESGYERATIRRIAESADVHPALVSHYFATKADLFAQAMELPDPVNRATTALRELQPDQWAGVLARTMLARDPAIRSTLIGVIRAATSDAAAAQTIKTFYEEQFLAILGDLGISHAEMRSVLLSSVAVGLVMTGDIVGLDGFDSASDATRLMLLTPVVDTILFTPLELPRI